jgi:hypothetical protein
MSLLPMANLRREFCARYCGVIGWPTMYAAIIR